MVKQRICGNCRLADTNIHAGIVRKCFKCGKDMKWVDFDETCDSHLFDGEEPKSCEFEISAKETLMDKTPIEPWATINAEIPPPEESIIDGVPDSLKTA